MQLSIDNLIVRYGMNAVINGVSFGVDQGELVTLIGPNGAGKSTILKAIMNIGGATLTSGHLLFEGEALTGRQTHHIITKGISYIPQGNSVFGSMTVEANLKVALQSAGQWKEGLETIYHRYPMLKERRRRVASQLSGGERQVLGLARALVTRPKLLLLDEPSIGLSPKFSSEIFDRIHMLKDEGVSILLVEQKVREAEKISDRVCILKRGRVFYDGPWEEARKGGHLEKAYLGG